MGFLAERFHLMFRDQHLEMDPEVSFSRSKQNRSTATSVTSHQVLLEFQFSVRDQLPRKIATSFKDKALLLPEDLSATTEPPSASHHAAIGSSQPRTKMPAHAVKQVQEKTTTDAGAAASSFVTAPSERTPQNDHNAPANRGSTIASTSITIKTSHHSKLDPNTLFAHPSVKRLKTQHKNMMPDRAGASRSSSSISPTIGKSAAAPEAANPDDDNSSSSTTKNLQNKNLLFHLSTLPKDRKNLTKEQKELLQATQFFDVGGMLSSFTNAMPFLAEILGTALRANLALGTVVAKVLKGPLNFIKQGANVAGSIMGPTTSAAMATMVKEQMTPEKIESFFPPIQNPRHWIKHHNFALDQGQKFMIMDRSPLIQFTDLFNLNGRFGCHAGDDFQQKFWWHHPQIRFGIPLGEIKVTLQNDLTGEIKWDAVYDLGNSTFLRHDAEPLTGKHPFFVPDWCDIGGGVSSGSLSSTNGAGATTNHVANTTAQAWTLTVTNLGSKSHPDITTVGKIRFNQYPFPLLETNYSYESDIAADDMRVRNFDIPGIPSQL
ncbi:unnamed protein product [Amoebophrya sp. A120]|nr:unnamed protein product [Amoebophrya sp. A120]|eukprot:GSA120T00014584001.1